MRFTLSILYLIFITSSCRAATINLISYCLPDEVSVQIFTMDTSPNGSMGEPLIVPVCRPPGAKPYLLITPKSTEGFDSKDDIWKRINLLLHSVEA